MTTDLQSQAHRVHRWKVTTAATVEPVTTSDMLEHLRIDDTDELTLIDDLIAAARGYVEVFTRRALITQTITSSLNDFPANRIALPRPPVQSVTSISYLDTGGSSQTLSTNVYDLDITSDEEATIFLKFSQVYPSTQVIDNAVTIVSVHGHGNAATDVPPEARQAMRLLVGHWFEHRESVVVGTVTKEIEQAVSALLWSLRTAA